MSPRHPQSDAGERALVGAAGLVVVGWVILIAWLLRGLQ